MKYFIDTEFIEGFHKPLFGKKRHFIDLISIGVFSEDGRQYYAISNEFNYRDADDWVKENVISKLKWWQDGTINTKGKYKYGVDAVLIGGKSNKQISEEIKEFCKPRRDFSHSNISVNYSEIKFPEFYGYYSDYDWVLFCSLFGRMIDLPNGFPMYCKDLKQMLDEKEFTIIQRTGFDPNYYKLEDTIVKNEGIKKHPNYPKQSNEHNALDDAEWNFKLYKFLQTL